jgi:hypothetical protein
MELWVRGDSRALRPHILFQEFDAAAESLDLIGAGDPQPLERRLDTLVHQRLQFPPRRLARLPHAALEDPERNEGVIDPLVDLGPQFLLCLLGTPDEFRLEIVRLLLGQLGAVGNLCGQVLDLLAGQAGRRVRRW